MNKLTVPSSDVTRVARLRFGVGVLLAFVFAALMLGAALASFHQTPW